jgi:hypothetical protein
MQSNIAKLWTTPQAQRYRQLPAGVLSVEEPDVPVTFPALVFTVRTRTGDVEVMASCGWDGHNVGVLAQERSVSHDDAVLAHVLIRLWAREKAPVKDDAGE